MSPSLHEAQRKSGRPTLVQCILSRENDDRSARRRESRIFLESPLLLGSGTPCSFTSSHRQIGSRPFPGLSHQSFCVFFRQKSSHHLDILLSGSRKRSARVIPLRILSVCSCDHSVYLPPSEGGSIPGCWRRGSGSKRPHRRDGGDAAPGKSRNLSLSKG